MEKSDTAPDERFVKALLQAQPALRGYCMASINHVQDAHDVFQSTCLVLWKKSSDWDPETPFLRWAYAVARYEVLSYLRDRKRDRVVFDDDVVQIMSRESGREDFEGFDHVDLVDKCLGRLSDRSRKLLSSYYEGTEAFQEVSRLQKRSYNGAKVVVCRIRKALSDCVKTALGTRLEGGVS